MIQELIQLLVVGVYHQAFAGTILVPFLSSLVKVLGTPSHLADEILNAEYYGNSKVFFHCF